VKATWNSAGSTKELLDRTASALEWRDRFTKSQWAEKFRQLSPEASSQRGGKFTFNLAPWQREVLDAPDDPEVSRVVCIWASQVTGKTETINNIVAHHMDIDPCPMLILQPTLELAETWSKDRLSTMIRDNPRLRILVRDPRSRDSENAILHKRFRGGAITIAGANSPASLSSRPIRVVIFDETDRFPVSAGAEGDPCALAEKRQESFPDAVVVEASAPTLKGFSRIEKSFEDSDKCEWFVTCPACKHAQTLKWAMVKWEEKNPKNAWMECEKCSDRWDDATRRELVLNGTWKATAPFNGVRGYHLNGLVCLFRPKKPHKSRLIQFVADFLKAKAGGKYKLQVWTNTFLAESWSEEGERIDTEPILERREPYGPKIPQPVIVLTAGVDIQGDRIEAEIVGHGRNEETWGIEYARFFGNPHQQTVWEQLDNWLSGDREREDGARLKVSIACVDTGDGKTQKPAYAFIKPRQARRIFATKGSNVANAALVRRSHPSKRNPVPQRVHLFIIGTDTAKATLHARLQLEDHGPRFQHFPQGCGYDEEFFRQLTAEEMRTEYVKGFPRRVWFKIRARNEALDIRVLNLAAFEILNPRLDEIEKANLATLTAPQNATHSQPRDYALNATETEEAPKVRVIGKRGGGVNRVTGERRGKWMGL